MSNTKPNRIIRSLYRLLDWPSSALAKSLFAGVFIIVYFLMIWASRAGWEAPALFWAGAFMLVLVNYLFVRFAIVFIYAYYKDRKARKD